MSTQILWPIATMAEPHSIAQELLKKLEDQLTCGVCLNSYNNPKLLQCFHVFCKDCLERLVVQDHQGLSLCCPNCRRSTLLPPDGVSGLQSAFHTNHLFEIQDALKKLKEPQKTQCEKCEKRVATNFCRDCGQFICTKCTETHQEWKELSSHEVVTIDQLQTDMKQLVPPKKKAMFCSKHPTKDLDLYCETCDDLICQHCIVQVHRDHQYDLVPDAFPKHKDVIVSSLQPVEQQLETVNKALEQLDTQSQNIKDQRETVARKIHESIKKMQDLLEERKVKLIGQLDQITQKKLKALAAQRDQIVLVQTQLSSCLNFVNESLRSGSQGEILAMKKPVVKQIKEITADLKPNALVPQEQDNIQFFGSSDLPLICQQFGKVCAHLVSPEKYYATGKGLQAAVVGEESTVLMHAVEVDGRECDKPLENVKCELISEVDNVVVRGKVEKKNSQYEISYQPIHRGKHQLSIRVEEVHIKGSPFTVAAIPRIDTLIKVIEEVSQPWGVTVGDSGEIVVAERKSLYHCVSTFTQNGERIGRFGAMGSGHGKFNHPTSVVFDSAGNILVVDGGNHRVQKFTAEEKFITAVGKKGSEHVEFELPVGIGLSLTNKKVYVCDRRNHRVQILNEDLTFSSSFGSSGSGDEQFNCPWDVAFDSTGSVYIADGGNHCIQVFTPEGKFLRKFGKEGRGEGELDLPSSVCIDYNDIVYITELNNHRVSIFTGQGIFIRSFGTKGTRVGEFNKPRGIAVDINGRIYVSDTNNNRVQIF